MLWCVGVGLESGLDRWLCGEDGESGEVGGGKGGFCADTSKLGGALTTRALVRRGGSEEVSRIKG